MIRFSIVDIILENIFRSMFLFIEPGTAMLIASAISAAGGIAGGMMGGKGSTQELEYKQLPGYEESDAARGTWWDKLQEWGDQPGYGAITPDFADIWDNAKQKVSQYYWGGPLNTGVADKVKASAARRGVSGSPAQDELLARMGMQEGIDLKDIATQQATKQADLSEQGRTNWMNSLMGLSQLKPQFVTSTGTTSGSGYGAGNMVADITGAAGGAMNQYAQNKWYEDMFKNLNSGQNSQLGTGNIASSLGNADLSGATNFTMPNNDWSSGFKLGGIS